MFLHRILLPSPWNHLATSGDVFSNQTFRRRCYWCLVVRGQGCRGWEALWSRQCTGAQLQLCSKEYRYNRVGGRPCFVKKKKKRKNSSIKCVARHCHSTEEMVKWLLEMCNFYLGQPCSHEYEWQELMLWSWTEEDNKWKAVLSRRGASRERNSTGASILRRWLCDKTLHFR